MLYHREIGPENYGIGCLCTIQESWLIRISSQQIVNGMDIGYILASNHYLRLAHESLVADVKNVTNVCHLTAKQTAQAISQKIRGRCIKKNESKIFTDTYVVAGAIQTSTLLPKFSKMKHLSSYNDFIKKGDSIYSVFDSIEASEIYKSENLNRDYNDEGTELFNDGSTDENEIDHTMSVSSVLHRNIPIKNKLIVKYNIIRCQTYNDGDDKIFGATTEWKQICDNATKKSRKRKRNEI
eukprot:327892_1